MMKEDERRLRDEFKKNVNPHGFCMCDRALVARLGIHPNRAAYILEKMSNRGEYEYGVNVLHGWLTEKGKVI